jgi:MSHA biogenesis protein MshP
MISILPNFSGRPWNSGISLPGRQRGVSVITAVFLMLLMAVLAAAIANVVSTANVNMAADIGGARAYQAARAGAEWGMYQLDPNATTAALPPCFPDAAPPIPGHVMDVKCTKSDTTEGSRSIRIYRITSVATATGVKAPGIERRIEVTVEKCRDPVNTPAAPFDC